MLRFLLAAMTVCVSCGALQSAEETQVPETADAVELTAKRRVYHSDDGWVFFMDGLLEAPFRIEADASSLWVNGREVRLNVDVINPGDYEDDEYDSDGLEDEYFDGRRGRNRDGGKRRPGATRSIYHKIASRIEGELNAKSFIVFADESMPLFLSSRDDQYLLCSVMSGLEATAERQTRLRSLISADVAGIAWRNWLDQVTLSGPMLQRMTEYCETSTLVANENARQIDAVRRLDLLSYPLTVIGMLLSVIAFGSMLQWIARGLGRPGQEEPHGPRFATAAVLLMMGMSVLDLIWTVLALQAGQMRETNPLAAGLVPNPLHLAAFKVLATGVGLAILYGWRHRQVVQQATWWMCLVCVLLTFRWVVFDSMVR